MKSKLLILLFLPFCVKGQISTSFDYAKINSIANSSRMLTDSLNLNDTLSNRESTIKEIGSLNLTMMTPFKQFELKDSLVRYKIINQQYKPSRKQNPYNNIDQPEKGNNIPIIVSRSNSIIDNNLDDTPLGLQIHGFATLSGIADNIVPFWMRSMQYGSIPLNGLSTSAIAGIQKAYDPNRERKLLDWGAAAEARINVGSTSQLILIEAYAKARLSIFQLEAGRSKDHTGLVDSTLSSGAFAVSGNAMGIPKIELSVPEYWELPYTHKLIAIKGTFVHGFFGDQALDSIKGSNFLTNHVKSFYHQFSFYGRLGKPNWHVKFYGGFNHQVMWGNESKIFKGWSLSGFKEYLYVVTGKGYGSIVNGIDQSRVGNHIGSIDQGFEITLKNSLLSGYHQFFYDAGALYYLANIKDGIWGLSLKNNNIKLSNFEWKKFLIEFLYSKSQGGEPNSVPRPSASEDYYNNYIYQNGWSYMNENVGNPLFISRKFIRSGFPQYGFEYFSNNRIIAIHTGSEFALFHWNCKTLFTWSANYGTWNTAPATRLYDSIIQYNKPPYFPEVNQFSGYIEANHPLKKGYFIGFALAADKGELLNNSVGGFVKITKTW